MNFETIYFEIIDEKMHVYEHESGLKAFLIPKKGYYKKYAAVGVNYGSADNAFVIPGENQVTRVPDGVAHFLEHKLFEQKDGNVMDKFSRIGSNPNAYTAFNQTVYLFSATGLFIENFKLLLDFIQNPYITSESVENEKGIIGQEIRMYQDDPRWRVFFNLLNAFYAENPVRIDIAGSIDSIGEIDREILYKCYTTFYHPSNAVILTVGDVEPEEVFGEVEKKIINKNRQGKIKRIKPGREIKPVKKYIQQKLSVSLPVFQMGFMDNKSFKSSSDLLFHEMAVKILLELILGRSTGLYNRLYEEGLINSTFDADVTIEEDFAFSVFGGESPEPEKVRDKILNYIDTVKKNLDIKDFDRARKAMYGRFVRQFNSIEKIAHSFMSTYFKNYYLFDYFSAYDKINFEYAMDVLISHFNEESMALSVIKPV